MIVIEDAPERDPRLLARFREAILANEQVAWMAIDLLQACADDTLSTDPYGGLASHEVEAAEDICTNLGI